MQYIAYKVTVQITEQLSTRQTYSEQCQTIKMKSFAKRQVVFVKVGHFDKHFLKNTKKRPRSETFWGFSP